MGLLVQMWLFCTFILTAGSESGSSTLSPVSTVSVSGYSNVTSLGIATNTTISSTIHAGSAYSSTSLPPLLPTAVALTGSVVAEARGKQDNLLYHIVFYLSTRCSLVIYCEILL